MNMHEAAAAMLLAIEREMPNATETAARFPEIEAARLALATADPKNPSDWMACPDCAPRIFHDDGATTPEGSEDVTA